MFVVVLLIGYVNILNCVFKIMVEWNCIVNFFKYYIDRLIKYIFIKEIIV